MPSSCEMCCRIVPLKDKESGPPPHLLVEGTGSWYFWPPWVGSVLEEQSSFWVETLEGRSVHRNLQVPLVDGGTHSALGAH